MTVRVVIADDEPLVRERLRMLLAPQPGYTVVAECADGAQTVEVISREQPDLLFLDVQMPELDGFEVLEVVPPRERPAVIFVTAYDDYALRAFEVNAVDYLLKPVEPGRFAEALQRAQERRQGASAEAEQALRSLLSEYRARRGRATRLVVRDGSRVTFVSTSEVEWIDSAGNYARLHTTAGEHLLRETLKSLEARLDPERFVRVHRSAIVNVERIVSLEPYFHGEYVLILKGGARLTSSRSHSARLRALLR